MKSIYKLIMAAAVFAGTEIAVAGTQYVNYSQYINGEGGLDGGRYLYTYRYCSEFPDGAGGISVIGEAGIYGDIAGVYVEERVDFSGLDRCPDSTGGSGDVKGNEKGVSYYSISVNEVMVDATCTGQASGHGSGHNQFKIPGQKPQNLTLHSTETFTLNPDNGDCVITGTVGNDTETYVASASASEYSAFRNESNR